jgi:hypothetical protein
VNRTSKSIIIIGSVLLFLVAVGIWCLREWAEVAWRDRVEFRVKSVAISVEVFRHDQGHYPVKLSELLTNEFEDEKGKQTIGDLIKDEKEGGWPETLTYKTPANGFTLVISGPELPPAGWFGKKRRVEKNYQAGEALNGFENDVTPR